MVTMEQRKCIVCDTLLTKQKVVCSYSCRNKLYTTKGKEKTEEHKRKIAEAHTGMKKPWTVLRNKKYPNVGEKSGNWKGNNVGYIAIHNWAHKWVGLKDKCELCPSNIRLEMANISGQYKRESTDWRTLCRVCHVKVDKEFRQNGGVTRKLQKWKKK